MRLRYTATARNEVEAILDRIINNNPSAAASVAAAIKTAAFRLRSFPLIGTETNRNGIYMEIACPYHYLIFYEINGQTVVIRNVRHRARRRPTIP